MRSLFKTLTITAVVITGLAGVSYAAPHGDGAMHPGRNAHVADQPDTDDLTPPMPVYVRAAMQPHLATVLHEVRAAQHRIAMDRHEGRLTPAAARRLHARAATIRAEALSAAASHGGRLPNGTFATLQHDMMRLDRSITRMA